MNLGHALDSALIVRGLLELCPDLVFDVVNNLPDGEMQYVMVMDPRKRGAVEKGRMPVCYREKYICSMDRGMVPEVKLWHETQATIEIPASEDDDFATYCRTAPADRSYPALLERVQSGDESCKLNPDGSITRWWTYGTEPRKGSIQFLGWRHLFENLLRVGVPGITREALQLKFGVDMYKFPLGPPEEVVAALLEE